MCVCVCVCVCVNYYEILNYLIRNGDTSECALNFRFVKIYSSHPEVLTLSV